MQTPAEKCFQVLFLDCCTRSQAQKAVFILQLAAASCDTSVKIGTDGQFDMLKKITCRPQLLNAQISYL